MGTPRSTSPRDTASRSSRSVRYGRPVFCRPFSGFSTAALPSLWLATQLRNPKAGTTDAARLAEGRALALDHVAARSASHSNWSANISPRGDQVLEKAFRNWKSVADGTSTTAISRGEIHDASLAATRLPRNGRLTREPGLQRLLFLTAHQRAVGATLPVIIWLGAGTGNSTNWFGSGRSLAWITFDDPLIVVKKHKRLSARFRESDSVRCLH